MRIGRLLAAGARRFPRRLSTRVALALAAYGLLLAVLPLSDNPSIGVETPVAALVLICLVHFGVGLAIPRPWTLLLPIGAGLMVFALEGAEGLAWLVLIFAVPVLVLITAAGVLIGRRFAEWSGGLALAAFAIATVPAVSEAAEAINRSRAGHLPKSVQAQLPLDLSLGNLCPGAETPRKLRADLERRGEVLVRELQRHPNNLVAYTFYYSDEPNETRDITVRELAREQLFHLNAVKGCAPRLKEAIQDAL